MTDLSRPAVDSEDLRKYVAVAEELHFGRAAERLGMAQPPLSRAIRQLEDRLGTELLIRNSRGVRLTEAGEALLHEGRKALEAVSAAVRRTQRAGKAEPRLVVAMKPGGDAGLLAGILEAYERDPDAIPVDLEFSGPGEASGLLRDGRADLAFLHTPYENLSGFDVEELLTLRTLAVLPRNHRLAHRRSLQLADLDGEPMPNWSTENGGRIHHTTELMQLISLGRLVALLPESVRANLRSDLVTVPVLDAQPNTIMLAWPERSRSRAVAAFVRAATESREPAQVV